MFSDCFKERWPESISLKDIDGATFEEVIQFVYNGKVHIHDNNVYDLLHASNRLRVTILENWCVRYLIEVCVPTNHALKILFFACFARKNSLIPPVSRFILRHLELFARSSEYLRAPFDVISTLLSHWGPASSGREHTLLDIIFQWVSHSSRSTEDKKSCFIALADIVQFRHISNALVVQYFDKNVEESCGVNYGVNHKQTVSHSVFEIKGSQLSLHMFMRARYASSVYNEKLDVCNCFTSKKYDDYTVDWYPPVRVRSATDEMRTVAFNDRLYSLSYENSDNGRLAFRACTSVNLCTDLQLLKSPSDHGYNLSLESAAVCCDRINIYLCTHFDSWRRCLDSNLLVYKSELNEWFPVFTVRNHDENFRTTLVTTSCSDGRLYLIGRDRNAFTIGNNRPNVLRAYDHRAGKLEKLANTIRSHSVHDRCCSHTGKIYASSEEMFAPRRVLLEVYDPVADKWEEIEPLYPTDIRHVNQLVSFNNEVWMFGDFVDFEHNLLPIERYNSFTRKWSVPYTFDYDIENQMYPIDKALYKTNKVYSDDVLERNVADVVVYKQ